MNGYFLGANGTLVSLGNLLVQVQCTIVPIRLDLQMYLSRKNQKILGIPTTNLEKNTKIL